ncbi:MAG: tripartite tricarboxylate transporter substrate binding protein [Rubrivivax sp.]|jgi:tripartite-type tricarboxylate transporter receptor subunit TctC|nr:tripartite tricarboxylate transporter substrate binding protein [Rubrivivax sp.]
MSLDTLRLSLALSTRRSRRRTLSAVCASVVLGIAALLGPAASAQAQAPAPAAGWPGKGPLRLVAVFPPGGSVDQVARILAPVLQQQIGQTVVVENKGGASGAIGTGEVARAEADGSTWGVVFDTHGVNPALQPKIAFDTRKDLVTVALLGTSPMVISTHTAQPYKSFNDVAAAARGSGAAAGIPYGTIGNGSLGHLAVTLLAKGAGLNLVHVPYKGGGPLMQDAIAGHVPLSIGSVFVAKPHLDSGKIRALAVTTAQRHPSLPDVPTLAELGFRNFEAPAWWAVVAPAKTPADIVQRMNAEINKALRQPEVAAKLAAQGISVNTGTPAQAQAFVERQMDTWAKVVTDNGIKAD